MMKKTEKLVMRKVKESQKNIISFFFMEVSAKEGFKSPNFLELAAISLYEDYENNKDDDNDISATLLNRTESIMLAGTKTKKKDICC